MKMTGHKNMENPLPGDKRILPKHMVQAPPPLFDLTSSSRHETPVGKENIGSLYQDPARKILDVKRIFLKSLKFLPAIPLITRHIHTSNPIPTSS